MSYPTSIDSIPQPTPTSPSNNPSNAGVAVAQTNAIVALETKLGTGASTPTSGTVLTGNGTGTSTWGGTTGSGNVVLATSPTLVTPALGTPASGVATNLTGTASGLTAGDVTTNANLTGPITSSGNATSIASQTGTGSKFVVDTSPTIVTPTIVRNANPVMSLNGNPVWQYLGYTPVTNSSGSTSSATAVQQTAFATTVTTPSGITKVRITVFIPDVYTSGSGANTIVTLWSGTFGSGSPLNSVKVQGATASGNGASPVTLIAITDPSSGSITYTVGLQSSTGSGGWQANDFTTTTAFTLVECC